MVRVITQVILGLTLLFAVFTLLPRGIICLRLKYTGKGIMYLFLALVSAFFAVLSFRYAYWVYTGS
jgi:hypothetical protein